MSFTDKQEFKIPRHIVQPGAVNPETITTNKTLTYRDAKYQLLRNNTGTLDCILPSYKNGAFLGKESSFLNLKHSRER